jgi:beta-mannosidase
MSGPLASAGRRLSEGWKVADFAPGEGLERGAHLAGYADGGWLDTAVPGDVHRALIAAGRIPDPFYDQNESACAWMEQREWWYRLTFDNPDPPPGRDERVQAVFEGLDTFATIYLNGAQIGAHHNMFRPAVFDVSLSSGTNTLAVRFDPPRARIAGKTLSAWGRNPERTAMRKAQFGYGWDWGPRLPTIGIWRPVEVRRLRRGAIVGVHFSTLDLTRDASRAAVAVRVEAEHFFGTAPLAARIELVSPEGAVVAQTELGLGGEGPSLDATAYLTVDQPRLWWTHELGEPCLYELSTTLFETGAVLDEDRRRVGIRTLALDQSPDPEERGTRFFRFVLNGVPIFAKGADWVPCDSFVGAIAPERYTRLVEAARAANMIMLRIWGGGLYEHDHFYAECDRLGLLVWQDFMFACAMYPEDDVDFVAEVDAEARYQVRRLRSHPCLALWCGNNENQWLHERTYWTEPSLPPYGALYYDTILPRAVAELDGRTPYWPGTPYGGNDHNSRQEGNVHNWEVWHGNIPRRFGEQPRADRSPDGVSYTRYAEDLGRFISEFGMHAAPAPETLRRVIPPEQWFQHSPSLDWHNKDSPKNKGDNLLLASTGLPTDLDQYMLFSQIAQAEGLKFGVEHFRRRKPHFSGTLVWQLNDCWPVLSWSVIDYFGFVKAGYYYLKRAYAPVLASFRAGAGGEVQLWVTNDTLFEVRDTVTVRLGTFAGQVAWEGSREVVAPAGSSMPVWIWLPEELAGAPDRYLTVRSARDAFPANRHFFTAIKDLRRQPTAPSMTVEAVGPHDVRVDLRAPADGYVYFAYLLGSSESTRYSDNYIDLVAGETRTLIVTDPTRELTPASLSLGWA